MTPTPTVLLLVALFWTLPASTAVLVYRKHGRSMDTLKAALQRRIDNIGESLQKPRTQPDA